MAEQDVVFNLVLNGKQKNLEAVESAIKGFRSSISAFNSAIRENTKALTEHTKSLNALAKSGGEAAASVTKAAKATSEATKTSTQAASATQSHAKGMDDVSKAAIQVSVAMDRANRTMKEGHIGIAGMTKDLRPAAQSLRMFQKQMYQQSHFVVAKPQSVKHLINNMEQAKKVLQDTNMAGWATVGTMRSLEDGIPRAFKGAFNSMDQFNIRLHVAKRSTQDLLNNWLATSSQMQWQARQLMVGVSAPLAMVGTMAFNSFLKVSREQVRLTKVSSFARDEINAHSDAITRLGHEYATAQSLVTGLMADWAQMGYGSTLDELDAITEKVLRFSQLTDTDVSKTTPFFQSIIATFASEASDPIERAGQVMEEFNAIENNTVMSTRVLAEALPQVAGSANVLGLEAFQTAAMLTGMYRRTGQATEAAHALKFGLQRLANPTTAARDYMNLFGVSLFDAEGGIRNTQSVLEDLARAMGPGSPFTDEQKFAGLGEIFGKRQAERWLVNLDEMRVGLEEIAEMQRRVGDGPNTLEGLTSHWAKATIAAQGYFDTDLGKFMTPADIANREMEELQKDVSYRWDQIRVAFTNNMIRIGEVIAEPVVRIGEIFMSLMTKIASLPESVLVAASAFGVFVAAVGPFMFVAAMLKKLGAIMGLGALKVIPTAFEDITKSMAEMRIALTGSTEGLAQVGDKFLLAKNGVKSYGDEVIATSDTIARAKMAPDLSQAPMMSPATAVAHQKAVSGGTPDVIVTKGADAVKEVGEEGKKVGGIFSRIGGIISRPFQILWNVIRHPIQAIKTLGGFVSGLGGTILRLAPAIAKFAVVGAVISAILVFVKAAISNFDKWRDSASSGFEKIRAALGKVREAFSPIIDIVSSFMGASEQAISEGGGFWAGFGSLVEKVLEGIAKGIEFVAWVIRGIAPILESFANAVLNVVRFVQRLIDGDLVGVIREFVGFLYNLFLKPVLHILEAIADGFFRLVANIIGALATALEKLGDFRQYLHSWAGPLSIVGDVAGSLVAPLDAVSGKAASAMRSVQGSMRTAADFDVVSLMAPVDRFFGNMEVRARRSGKKAGQNIKDEIGDGMLPQGIDDGEDYGEGFVEGADNKVKDWFPSFLSAVKSRLDKAVDEMKKAATDALKKSHDVELKMYDDRIKAIDSVIKAEEEALKDQEYFARRRDMLRNREIQRQNYEVDRALAIYEGRFDDARRLDQDEYLNRRDHNTQVKDLDLGHQRDLINRERELEKERINIAKEAAQERLKVMEDEFRTQLDIITQYAPRTVAEFDKMINAITTLLRDKGVPEWEFQYATGVTQFQRVIKDANEDIIQTAAWSGTTAATAWLKAFATADAKEAIKAGQAGGAPAIKAPKAPNLSGINLGLGGGGGGGGSSVAGTLKNAGSGFRGSNLGASGSNLSFMGPVKVNRGNWMDFMGPVLDRNAPRFVAGGKVEGPVSTEDNILAMVQAGEFVLRRSAVARLGSDNVQALNDGKASILPKFAEGGLVGAIKQGMKFRMGEAVNAFLDGTGMIGGQSIKNLTKAYHSGTGTIGGKTGFVPMFTGGGGRVPLELSMGQSMLEALDRITNARGVVEDRRGYDPRYRPRAYGQYPITGFANWLFKNFPGGVNYGTYVYRNIAGTDKLSNHARGLAVDFGGTKQAMDNVFNFGYENYHKLGLQELIYRNIQMNRRGELIYRKKQDHWNHVHLAIKPNSPVAWMAKGGIVPYDNMLANLHKKEMVLPSDISTGLTNMIKAGQGGSSGSTGHTTIIQVDTFIGERRWFEKMMKDYGIKVEEPKRRAQGMESRRLSSVGR